MQCPGYRNLQVLRIRDETDRVARKAQKTEKAKNSVFPLDGSQTGRLNLNTMVLLSETDPNPFPPSIFVLSEVKEDYAIAYFMSSYIASSMFDTYLPDLYLQGFPANEALLSAILAVSFATYAVRIQDPRYVDIGRKQYLRALTQTNNSLANPETAILDRTLAAVLLLGLFESAVFQERTSLQNWTAHTLGTAALLRMRGLRQFHTKMSRLLFVQASYNIRTSCIQRCVPVPTDLLELCKNAAHLQDPKDPAVALSSILDAAASIRARSLNCNGTGLIYEALKLDKNAITVMANLDEELFFATRAKGESACSAYANISHRQFKRPVVKYRNSIHMIRLFLNEFIWERISAVQCEMARHMTSVIADGTTYHSPFSTDLKSCAVRNTAEIAEELLASVQEFIEPGSQREAFSPSARALFWPLGILQSSPICPASARECVFICLDRLGADLNFPQAVDAAKLTEETRGDKEDW